MRLPFALAALDWITPRDVQGARHLIDLDDQRGWVVSDDVGYCVATGIPVPTHHRAGAIAPGNEIPPPRWLTHLALVIAAQPDLRDDSLCIAHGEVWWVHRFASDACPAIVESQLRRQMLACQLVAPKAATHPAHGASAPSSSPSRSAMRRS
ncbi:hypothetical protein PPN31114_03057 [Pandoraea pneumonica]|jgi:hypothetical protein|uniref:Uncharacterized protein n=1 Tax=Pandoraea pneumonica TaxID=2508299 RepID=A0A5E4W7Q6_9BURK|nr:hypothetical protein [Pandoraea pneumonica]VVE19125.1 hypothetical protein PPN31114_03057 [Pandoraea pneumonica]